MEEVKLGATNDDNDGTAKTKKYTREQLFELAKLMDNSESIVECLERFEHADWTQYNLDVEAEENETRFNSLASFGRKNSELDHEYSSLIDHRVNSDWRRSQPIARLSRMTSSPLIRYGADNARNQFNTSQDGVPSHIKAKYAKLIESMSTNNSQQAAAAASRGASLDKSFSGATTSWRSSDQRSMERPTSLFGPPRRDSLRSQRSERGTSSEKHMSLPYIPVHSARDHSLTGGVSGGKGSSGIKPLLDQTNPSPVQRFTSSNRPPKANRSEADEEDDFDITSLLNITVLSDIKSIRQDQHQHQHQQGNTNRRALSRQLSNRGGRNEDVVMPMKPLIRARTSTDFTYQGRKLDNYEPNQKHQDNYSYFANDYRSSGPESFDPAYSWQTSTFQSREMARERQRNSDLREKAPIVDESVASIIKTFKAQVKARAEEAAVKSPPGSSSTIPKVTAQTKGATISPPGPTQKANAEINSVKKEVDEKERKVELNDLATQANHNSDKQNSLAVDELSKKQDDQQQKEGLESAKNTEKTNTANASELEGKNEVHEEMTKKPVVQSKLVSQIPRLIRLHDTTRKDPEPAPTAPKNETKVSGTSNQATREQPSLATKQKPRFVSQYKRLRGKSLADELDDVPK